MAISELSLTICYCTRIVFIDLSMPFAKFKAPTLPDLSSVLSDCCAHLLSLSLSLPLGARLVGATLALQSGTRKDLPHPTDPHVRLCSAVVIGSCVRQSGSVFGSSVRCRGADPAPPHPPWMLNARSAVIVRSLSSAVVLPSCSAEFGSSIKV